MVQNSNILMSGSLLDFNRNPNHTSTSKTTMTFKKNIHILTEYGKQSFLKHSLWNLFIVPIKNE